MKKARRDLVPILLLLTKMKNSKLYFLIITILLLTTDVIFLIRPAYVAAAPILVEYCRPGHHQTDHEVVRAFSSDRDQDDDYGIGNPAPGTGPGGEGGGGAPVPHPAGYSAAISDDHLN
ncbi:hypothetical protein H6P81_016124 [Aristolochia fimbriata]|uniref:Uncharacterized protein n=1 Tax=Aristolochia fimbriata TaxID=158543 RepID=A0AAV7E7T6_ARIFI|nr:hypothetical protein H6P81_016124 [Aristolochia fimbriata]